MQTRVLSTEHPQALDLALETLRAGGLVVFPTDTLYGLGCNPNNSAALASLYAAKNRPTLKAIPVLIGETGQLQNLITALPPIAARLITRFWPGPLTLVLPRNPALPPELTPYPGLAVRMPNHPFALALLRAAGPLAVTSANISEHENPQDAAGVRAQLDGKVELILDGGRLSGGTASTIIDCMDAEPKLLREGPIRFEDVLTSQAED
ncbi:MAG TPA: L-threonylcarbamoyladenylate synthase [Anaerolineaceae bacterium]|nr:L-threonylcarbamoyladenylate synthase [Anaerolineaceae bacterium]HQK42213.1 L-threonylcarbamoyladenylate synthase [Anaerolineaceae bacterium]